MHGICTAAAVAAAVSSARVFCVCAVSSASSEESAAQQSRSVCVACPWVGALEAACPLCLTRVFWFYNYTSSSFCGVVVTFERSSHWKEDKEMDLG
jgi:hypothetical protein